MRQDVGNQERLSLAHVDGAGSEVLDQDKALNRTHTVRVLLVHYQYALLSAV